MNTRDIWREQSFIFIDEASVWLARDFYNNNVDGVVSVLEYLIERAQNQLTRYHDYSLDNAPEKV